MIYCPPVYFWLWHLSLIGSRNPCCLSITHVQRHLNSGGALVRMVSISLPSALSWQISNLTNSNLKFPFDHWPLGHRAGREGTPTTRWFQSGSPPSSLPRPPVHRHQPIKPKYIGSSSGFLYPVTQKATTFRKDVKVWASKRDCASPSSVLGDYIYIMWLNRREVVIGPHLPGVISAAVLL